MEKRDILRILWYNMKKENNMTDKEIDNIIKEVRSRPAQTNKFTIGPNTTYSWSDMLVGTIAIFAIFSWNEGRRDKKYGSGINRKRESWGLWK